jgi:hypothetical protein
VTVDGHESDVARGIERTEGWNVLGDDEGNLRAGVRGDGGRVPTPGSRTDPTWSTLSARGDTVRRRVRRFPRAGSRSVTCRAGRWSCAPWPTRSPSHAGPRPLVSLQGDRNSVPAHDRRPRYRGCGAR